MRELSPLLEEIIASGGVAELTVTGRSMEPTLHDRKSRPKRSRAGPSCSISGITANTCCTVSPRVAGKLTIFAATRSGCWKEASAVSRFLPL